MKFTLKPGSYLTFLPSKINIIPSKIPYTKIKKVNRSIYRTCTDFPHLEIL